MQFIEAEWTQMPDQRWMIRATGDDDVVYWVSGYDSDVPPWPAFKEEHPEFPAEPPDAG